MSHGRRGRVQKAFLIDFCIVTVLFLLSASASWAWRADISIANISSMTPTIRHTVTCAGSVNVSPAALFSIYPGVGTLMATSYSIPVSALLVDDNSSTADYAVIQDAIDAAPDGGAVYVCPGHYYEKIDINKDLTLVGLAGADRTIIDASTSGDGNVVYIAASVTLRGFTITGATADSICYYGGGIKVGGQSGQTLNVSVIEQNKIIDNSACKVGGIYLGGFDSSRGEHVDNSVTVRNNIIAGNDAGTSNAGGIMASCDNLVDTVIENNVIADNTTTSGSGGIELVDDDCSEVRIRNNILYNNVSSDSQNVMSDSSESAKISYNDSYGNSTDYSGGTGNITSDPQFRDADDYKIRSTSPCVDAGNPAASANDTDGSRNDMGAYGGGHGDW